MHKAVFVKLIAPDMDKRKRLAEVGFGIDHSGWARYGRNYDDAIWPTWSIADPESRTYLGSDYSGYYPDVETLTNDYVSSYSGALVVGELVATSLEAAHRITVDNRETVELIEAWQGQRTSEYGKISPYIGEAIIPSRLRGHSDWFQQ
jgi:hypothetical protein